MGTIKKELGDQLQSYLCFIITENSWEIETDYAKTTSTLPDSGRNLESSVADPGSGALFAPGFGMKKIPVLGSAINILYWNALKKKRQSLDLRTVSNAVKL
jgi:hypothetical protein